MRDPGPGDHVPNEPVHLAEPATDPAKGKNLLWVAKLGSQTYGNPVVAGGRVFVGTNNGGGYRAEKHPADKDKGVMLCFDAKSGEFKWQLTRRKLEIGRVSDWPDCESSGGN